MKAEINIYYDSETTGFVWSPRASKEWFHVIVSDEKLFTLLADIEQRLKELAATVNEEEPS